MVLLKFRQCADGLSEAVGVVDRLQFHFPVGAPEEALIPSQMVLGLENPVHASVRFYFVTDLRSGDSLFFPVSEGDLQFILIRILVQDLFDLRRGHAADLLAVDIRILEEVRPGVGHAVIVTSPDDEQKEEDPQKGMPLSSGLSLLIVVLFRFRYGLSLRLRRRFRLFGSRSRGLDSGSGFRDRHYDRIPCYIGFCVFRLCSIRLCGFRFCVICRSSLFHGHDDRISRDVSLSLRLCVCHHGSVFQWNIRRLSDRLGFRLQNGSSLFYRKVFFRSRLLFPNLFRRGIRLRFRFFRHRSLFRDLF